MKKFSLLCMIILIGLSILNAQVMEEIVFIEAKVKITRTKKNELSLVFSFDLLEGWGMGAINTPETTFIPLSSETTTSNLKLSTFKSNAILHSLPKSFFGETAYYYKGKFTATQTISWNDQPTKASYYLTYQLFNPLKNVAHPQPLKHWSFSSTLNTKKSSSKIMIVFD